MARGNDNPRLGARLAAALGAAVVLGMAAVALNAARGTGLAGDGPAKGTWALLALGIVVVGWTLAIQVRRRQDRLTAGGTPTQSRIASLVLPGFILMGLATVVGVTILGTRSVQLPLPQPNQGVAVDRPTGAGRTPTALPSYGSADQPSSAPSSPPVNFQDLLIGFLVFLGVVLVVLLAVVLSRWLIARRRAGAVGEDAVDGGLDEDDGTGDALAGAVQAGRRALADDPDPRTAIIACYAAMEKSLAESGVSRRKADTPTELLQRAAEAGLVQGHAAQTLTDLFGEARYSTHPMGEHQRDQARAALESIGAHLAAAAAEADARFGVREEVEI
ncbi:DUF4129 domain-containing protein [Streptacidiphilus melanogenes]|uniref:DUF4129 domain-containing protein n=1 Tax=Streptacidiphilus melanogenes TaxID=411235 RepID=UPI00069344DB|nr:DUF4129 domain-containing protein [Streptacidiphilus melanogenes]